jgi:hypothetical protein
VVVGRFCSSTLLLISLAGFQACQRGEPKKDSGNPLQSAPGALDNIDQYVNEAPLFPSSGPLATLRKIAPLKHETVAYQDNPYVEGAKLEFRTLDFEGLTLYGVVDGGELAPISITITNSKWGLREGLNVGVSFDKVLAVLGPKSLSEKGQVKSFAGEAQTVDFTVVQNKITKIQLFYYFD